MAYRLDLHTHSTNSPDGGLHLKHYRHALESGRLDCVAITDHNDIGFALKARDALGERIIVGEEIMSTEGEIVGLFLDEPIKPGLSPEETIAAIRAQDGLVYIPHPFETIRKGLRPSVLERIKDDIDIMEVVNGRAFFQNRRDQALLWAKLHGVPGAASSDAHGPRGLGRTFSSLQSMPNRDNLLALLRAGVLNTRRPAVRSLLYPKMNKIKKRMLK